MIDPWLVAAALAIEAVVGYPDGLYRLIRHPVVWIGGLIGLFERSLNPPQMPDGARRLLGVVTLVSVCAIAGGAGWAVAAAPLPAPFAAIAVVVVATSGLAQRSLHDHVAAVATALHADDLGAARLAVGKIVGRDVGALDADQVAAAAIESLAESFGDGIVAPAFWFLLGGLPGLAVYKAVNTADSMIGHREEHWRAFGWASARLDDLMNLIPARLAGLLIAVAGRRGFKVMLRDASAHASPNAGWPEAAMAGALGRVLGGPASYDGVVLERPSLGDGPSPTTRDLDRALWLYLIACGLLWAPLIVGGLAWRR